MNGRTRPIVAIALVVATAVAAELTREWWHTFEWGTRDRMAYHFALNARDRYDGHPLTPAYVEADVARYGAALPAWQRRAIDYRRRHR